MTNFSIASFLMYLASIAPSPLGPERLTPEPAFNPVGPSGLVQQIGPLSFLFVLLVYVPLTVVGIVAWRMRGKPRQVERLSGRERALPPAPRGPDA